MSTFWHKMSNLKPVCSIKMWKLTEKSHFCALSVMSLRLVWILKLEGLLEGYVKCKNTMRGNVNFLTQNVKSLKPVISSIKMWKLTEKSHFCALSVMFLRLVSILKLEGLLQGYVKCKNTMRGNVNFLTQNVKSLELVISSIYMGILTEKSHFCALSVMFLRLVSILKLEGLLEGYVKCKNTMRGNVNFLTQNVKSLKPVISSIKMWKLTEKSHFCALSVMFLRLVSILKLEGLLQGYVKCKNTMRGNVNFLTQNVGPWTCYKQFIWGYWPKNHIFVPSPLCFWG